MILMARCSFHHNVAKPMSSTVKAVKNKGFFCLCFCEGMAPRECCEANNSTMSLEAKPKNHMVEAGGLGWEV